MRAHQTARNEQKIAEIHGPISGTLYEVITELSASGKSVGTCGLAACYWKAILSSEVG